MLKRFFETFRSPRTGIPRAVSTEMTLEGRPFASKLVEISDRVDAEAKDFLAEMVKSDLPARSIINSDFAIVNERLAVRGLQGLRVVDASVMPTMPSGNINAAVLMVAEKAADMIIEDARAER